MFDNTGQVGPSRITTTEAAQVLKCAPKTVAAWCRGGAIPAEKVGGQYLIDPNELRRFLERHAVA